MLNLQDKFEEKLGITQFKDKVYTGRFLREGKMEYGDAGEVINIDKASLEKIAQTHIGVPVIINHTELTANNINYEKVGTVSRVFINKDGFTDGKGKFHKADNWAWCDFVVSDPLAIELLEKEGWELSNSYLPTKKIKSNKDGVDKEIVEGLGLHLAIVEKGRYDTKIIMNNSKSTNKNSMIENIKDLKNLANKLANAIDNFTKKPKEAVEIINNSAEEVKEEVKQDNACGKKYENQYFVLENGEKVAVDEVINTLTAYQKEEEMNNAKSQEMLEAEYDVNGAKMKGSSMLDIYKQIKGNNTNKIKEDDQLDNTKTEEVANNELEIEIKEEDEEEEMMEKEEDKEEEEKEKKEIQTMDNSSQTINNSFWSKFNYQKHSNAFEKIINNGIPKEEDKNNFVMMNPFKF